MVPRRSRWLVLVVMLLTLTGCASALRPLRGDPPGSGVPRVSDLRLQPDRVPAGCPVTVRFQFEDEDGDLRHVVTHWVRQQWRRIGVGYASLQVSPDSLEGRRSGEIEGQVIAERDGRYWYHVQVEDAKGRKSNVLTGFVRVDAAPLSGPPQCSDRSPRGGTPES